jgi:cation diffusion facilitator family transporter
MALVADGKHVLADCYTTIGVLLGLGIAKWTQIPLLDPLIALVMAAALLFTGVPLVRQAINGLIDAADTPLLEKILGSLEKNRMPGVIRLHKVRAMKNGRRIHVDGHIVLPEHWSIEQGHDLVELYEKTVVKDIFLEGEIEFHLDPCRKAYCASCDLQDCPIRATPFLARPPLGLSEMIAPVEGSGGTP